MNAGFTDRVGDRLPIAPASGPRRARHALDISARDHRADESSAAVLALQLGDKSYRLVHYVQPDLQAVLHGIRRRYEPPRSARMCAWTRRRWRCRPGT